eukprot:TRINITY_DN1901_c0_g1_i1.p1 TRINITY_DN1901_c0_g1~~TRINITY_DN1901_c0_g1_i1.p1  ORF type:complete len:1494 (+),score=519.21 TRINITY_DN1901_c0_g1_i1:154-4635(+)
MPYVNLEDMRGMPRGTVPVTEIPRKVKEIQFDTFTSEDMRRLSQVNVFNAQLHEAGHQHPYTMLDNRMGVCDKRGVCGTCGLKLEGCVGHFGHMDLPLPVFHIGFFKTVLQVLKCVCKGCSKVMLVGPDRERLLAKMRNKAIASSRKQKIQQDLAAELAQAVKCPHCEYVNGRVRVVKGYSVPKLVHERYGDPSKKNKQVHLDERAALEYTMESALEAREDGQKRNLLREHFAKVTDPLTPTVVRDILDAIPPEDRELLDLDPNKSAASLLMSSIMVPPVCIRPYIDASATGGAVGEFKDDSLTSGLVGTLHRSKDVVAKMHAGDKSTQVFQEWDRMQLDYSMVLDTALPGYPGEKPTGGGGLVQRLKGKEGRFRKHLSGKRVDFSGRTVISPDPNLKITEVAIPIHVAKILTYPERVYEYNRPRLCQAIINGAEEYPGAIYLRKKGRGFKRQLGVLSERDRRRHAEELEVGDIVDRHMINGDCVIFNRQPSLHRISMMCHRARVLPYRTYRFNECCCAPYNADFDGDEMNIHLPQTEEARAECAILMSTARNMVSARHGEPMIAATQDFLTGGYLLTSKNRFFDRGQASQALAYMFEPGVIFELPPPCILKPRELWSGKQLFSLLVRPNPRIPISLNFETNTKFYTKDHHMCQRDGWVCFLDSHLLSGTLDKKIMGGGGKDGLFYHLMLSAGHAYSARCMWRLSRFTCMWLMNYGFSIGINDVTPSVRLIKRRDEIMADGLERSFNLIDQFNQGTLQADPGCTSEITLEAKVNGYLSGVRADCGSMCMKNQILHWHNAPFIMATCGSKGSPLNIGQMAAILGQQTVTGKRIGDGFIHRSLPHFERFSRKPEHRGFVANSFYSGLQPHEFWFHTMGGREGLVDTAVKTAETGYMQRRLVKAMEDLCVQYDSSVMDSQGTLIQRVFGDDGIDPLYTETSDFRPVSFDILWTNLSVGRRKISLTEKPLMPAEVMVSFDAMMAGGDRKNMFKNFSDKFRAELRQFWETKAQQLETIWKSLRTAAGIDQPGPAADAPTGAAGTKRKAGEMSSALDRMRARHSGRMQSSVSMERLQRLANDMLLITDGLMETVLLECIQKHEKYRCEPGTACGAIGAQSIGEPGTQMTLKTFHFAGVAAMSITQGVPRIAEIINAAKTIKTPLITGYLVNETCRRSAEVVRARVQQTTLQQIVKGFDQVYRANGECYVEVKLNTDAIFNMQLDITYKDIREAIVKYAASTTRKRHHKLPLKDSHIPIQKCTPRAIRIMPFESKGLLHCMSKILVHLPHIVVAGLPCVKRAILREYGKEKQVVTKTLADGTQKTATVEVPKYNLLIEGSDLLQVSSIPGMNPKRTVCNHIYTIEHVLGIEAARTKIIDEILGVMGNYGLGIDIRHMMQLADVMTFRGEVLGITRFGMSKMRDSVMMLASFEKTTDILFDAASHHRKDDKLGVSEQIIMGAPIKIGTGLFKLLQKVEKKDLKKSNVAPIFKPPTFDTGVR